MNDSVYIPVEKISTQQYKLGLKNGFWGGKADKKILNIIKNNSDNPYVDDETLKNGPII